MRILLVDDHTMFRVGLAMQVKLLRPGAVTLECEGPAQARKLLQESTLPFDVIVLDLGMPGFKGLEALAYFRGLCPEIPCAVVSGQELSSVEVGECVEKGAFCFIPKSADAAQVAQAIDCMVTGNAWLPASAVSVLGKGPSGRPPSVWSQAGLHITPRQAEVLRGLVQGKSNKVIARELGISDGTVKTHVDHIFEVLEVDSRSKVVIRLARLGIRIQDLVDPGA